MFKAPVRIAGIGSCLPEKIVTNDDIAKMPDLDTSDEWITQRTGIKKRHIARDDECTSDIAVVAAERAIKMAGITAKDIDLIISATITPDNIFPTLSNWVQKRLGCNEVGSVDVVAACSGFIYGLGMARNYVVVDGYKNVLLVGAETLSKITDWKDRDTCVLFADGAAAAILQPCEENSSWIGPVFMGSRGLPEVLITPGGGSRIPASHESVDNRDHYMKMAGREVFKIVVNLFETMSKLELERHKLTIDDIKYVIPHQVNQRIMDTVANRQKWPKDKIYSNLERVGNTSSASVPIALTEMVEEGLLERGDLIMSCVFGG
ncbi:MAG: beta-ketoacyl-ACP synthase III, partial [Planctomycetota bacterium]